MAQELADRRDIDFVIWEQLDGETYLKNPVFEGFTKKSCTMIINEARSLAMFYIKTIFHETVARFNSIKETCDAAITISDDAFGGL